MTSTISRNNLWQILGVSCLVLIIEVLAVPNAYADRAYDCNRILTVEERRALEEYVRQCEARGGTVQISGNCSGGTSHGVIQCWDKEEIELAGRARVIGPQVLQAVELQIALRSLAVQGHALRRSSAGKHCPACAQLLSEAAALERRAKAKFTANEAQQIKGSVDSLVGRIRQQILELHKAVPMSPQLPAASQPKQLPPGGPKPSPLPTPNPEPQPMPLPPGGTKPKPM